MDASVFPPTPAATARSSRSLGEKIRDLIDDLVKVFVLVMFIKLFFAEHYKIPTGSMTPTLIGGLVARVAVAGDKAKDLIFWSDPNSPPLVFVKHGDRYLFDPLVKVDFTQLQAWREAGRFQQQFDHILVNRMAYWFRWPRRGEIVVFKVPAAIYSAEAPTYIKRLVGEPGELLTFTHDGRLVADGRPVTTPDFFRTQRYVTEIGPPLQPRPESEIRFHAVSPVTRKIDLIHVPAGEAYVFGDNTGSSQDSRYWGGVPLNHFKGRAFLRIWPLTQLKFLK